MSHKTIACVLYPGITALDLVGPLQTLSVFAWFDPSWRVAVVAENLDPLATDTPLGLSASHTFEQVPRPDLVVVPGGNDPTFKAMADEKLLAWLREAAEHAQLVTSVCTGSLILGAAGLLEGRKATTHWAAHHLLPRLGATPVFERWVEDGPVITAAGVSAGIDLALHLIGRLAGEEMSVNVQRMIEYDPAPPYGPLEWEGFDRGAVAPLVDSQARAALVDHPELVARLLE